MKVTTNNPNSLGVSHTDLATFDSYWILGPHPSSPETLFLATGGNGHTFKNLPNVGKYVVQSLEGTLDPELAEAFRWRPFAEIGLPTMLIQDDEYEGYRFPKGTLFTWNSMAIALDEREYEQPARFWPERFLNADLNDVRKGHWSFGPGK